MSAGSNALWAGLGVLAGLVLAHYVEELEADSVDVNDESDGEGPNLRVVYDRDQSSDG